MTLRSDSLLQSISKSSFNPTIGGFRGSQPKMYLNTNRSTTFDGVIDNVQSSRSTDQTDSWKAAACTKLRRERLAQDLDALTIARALHIPVRYVYALEEGRFNELHGRAYALGHARAYARFLGLDEEELGEQIKPEVADFYPVLNLDIRQPIAEPYSIVAFAKLSCIVCIGGFLFALL